MTVWISHVTTQTRDPCVRTEFLDTAVSVRPDTLDHYANTRLMSVLPIPASRGQHVVTWLTSTVVTARRGTQVTAVVTQIQLNLEKITHSQSTYLYSRKVLFMYISPF